MTKFFQRFPIDFWKMCCGALLFFVSIHSVFPELNNVLRELGGTGLEGYILGAFSAASLIARPFSGYLTDTIGRKRVLVIGAACSLMAGLMYPVANMIWLFFLIRLLHGFSFGCTPTSCSAFTCDVVSSESRGEALGWQGLFTNIGSSLGFFIGSSIVLAYGANYLFGFSAIMGAIALLIFATLPESLETRHEPRSLAFRDALYFKAWPPAVPMVFACIVFGSLLTILPDYTTLTGIENKGAYMATYIASSILVRLGAGRFSDRRGRGLAASIGFVFQIASMAIMAHGGTVFGFYLSAILYGVGQGFISPALFAWASDIATGKRNQGRTMATLFVAVELGTILGSTLGGLVYLNGMPDYKIVFQINLVALSVGLSAIWLIQRYHSATCASL